MTGTELVNILKSPTSKIVIFGTLLITGTLVLLPILTRNDDPDPIVQETELRQEEKAPLDIDSNIPRFKLDRDSESADTSSEPPPVIGDRTRTRRAASPRKDDESAEKTSSRQREERLERIPRERDLTSLLGNRGDARESSRPNGVHTPIFVLSAAPGGSDIPDDTFLSSRYAPYGRLLDCKLVNTLESNVDGTPLIAIVIEDLWWTNAQGERTLIIPAGTEVHGKMGSCVRNRMMSDGNFILVWQITSGQVGMELQLQGRVLEKSNQAGDKSKATITDMAAGIPGRVMGNSNLNEMLQYTMAFARGLSEGFETTKTFDNGSTIITENDGTTQNALAKAFESLSNVALENITDKISKESYYIRVPAGTEFYLYIEQVTDIEKAAIADTMLNRLEQVKLAQEQNNSTDSSIERASQLHDALGNVFPRSLQKELKGVR